MSDGSAILRDVEEMVCAVKSAKFEGPYCLVYKGNVYEVIDGIAYLNGERVDFISDLDERERVITEDIHDLLTLDEQAL